jgi:hypothetical protein
MTSRIYKLGKSQYLRELHKKARRRKTPQGKETPMKPVNTPVVILRKKISVS